MTRRQEEKQRDLQLVSQREKLKPEHDAAAPPVGGWRSIPVRAAPREQMRGEDISAHGDREPLSPEGPR